MKRFLKFLLLLSTVCLFSCEIIDEFVSSNDDEYENEYENGNGNEEEQNPENLPDFCDVQTIEGWSNVRFCKNGTVIFTKNFDGTQQVSKALMFVPSEECGITSIYGEYDETGMPKYLSFDDAVVFVEDYKDGVADLTLIQGDEYMWAVDDLELSFNGSRVTRALNENNWVRNTCAFGGAIISAFGIGAGVVVTGSGVGTAGGLLMIGMSSAALAEHIETLAGPGDSGSFDISEYAIEKIQGIGLQTMVDVLTENEKSYLKTLWPDKFDFKNTLPKTPKMFWLDLTLGAVDAIWGKTVTEADKRRAFIIAHLGYQIVTGRADEITEHSARLYGYISPESLAPLNKFADVDYGIVLYPTSDENNRKSEFYYSADGGIFSIIFTRLEYNTEYTYFTYYYDKTNAAFRQGELKRFKTKGGDDLRDLLIDFYYDTGGDNWVRNYNWCTDAPLEEWYGISKDDDGIYLINLCRNNLTGSGSLSGCTQLRELDCEGNQLTSLDVSGCTLLTRLSFRFGSSLTSLNASGCTSLKELECYGQQLTSLDVSGCTALEYLDCRENQLTSLDVTSCTSLVYLNCSDNQLPNLDVSGCTALEELECEYNPLTSLDVSGCTALKELEYYCQQLTSLDVSGCTSLKELNCDNNQLTSLNVSGCTSLEKLNCRENQLTSLDVTSCTSLEYLNCSDNQLPNLDVSGCTALKELECDRNQLTSLDVTSCTSLEHLYCSDNQLPNLDVSGCTSLERLYNWNNPLTSLNASGCTSLECFCIDNQLTSLDVSGCTSLTSLDFAYGYSLTSLDVSGCTSLWSLSCRENPLTSLNVSGCTALEYLDCSNNQLTSLDVSGCTALEYLDCRKNKINQVITDFYDRIRAFWYDQRYTYYWNGEYGRVHYTDNGYGWWYPGEPQKGYHWRD